MRTVRWAACGVGGMAGRKIVRDGLLPAANCELAAVQSWPEKSAFAEGERYGVPAFVSVEDMLENVDCDAVYIASPQFLHFEQVLACARRARHVLCEKPLATTAADAQQMVDKCNAAGVLLGTDFNYRFHTLHQRMKLLIADGAIGKLVSGRCQFGRDFPPDKEAFRQSMKLAGGGAFGDLGNHAADLLEYVMGKRTACVMAMKGNTIHDYETEDSVAALLEFDGGGLGIVDAYFCSPIDTLRNDLEVNGTEGTLHTSGTLQMETTGTLTLRRHDVTTIYQCPNQDMYRTVFERFAASVISGTELPASGNDGLHSQRLIEAVYRSSNTGSRIKLDLGPTSRA